MTFKVDTDIYTREQVISVFPKGLSDQTPVAVIRPHGYGIRIEHLSEAEPRIIDVDFAMQHFMGQYEAQAVS